MKFDLSKRDTEEGRTELYNCLMGMVLDAIYKTVICIDIAKAELSDKEKIKDNLEHFWRWVEVAQMLEAIGKPQNPIESITMQAACNYMDLKEFDGFCQELDFDRWGNCALNVYIALSTIKKLRSLEETEHEEGT